MDEDSLLRCLARLQDLWPEWEATNAELLLWRNRLRPHEAGHVRRGIEDYRLETERKCPQFGGVFRHISRIERAVIRNRPRQPVGFAESGFYVQRENDGTFVALCYGGSEQRDPARVAADAEIVRHTCQGVYGGTWRVLRETTLRDMMLERQRLRLEAGSDRPVPNCQA